MMKLLSEHDIPKLTAACINDVVNLNNMNKCMYL